MEEIISLFVDTGGGNVLPSFTELFITGGNLMQLPNSQIIEFKAEMFSLGSLIFVANRDKEIQ